MTLTLSDRLEVSGGSGVGTTAQIFSGGLATWEAGSVLVQGGSGATAWASAGGDGVLSLTTFATAETSGDLTLLGSPTPGATDSFAAFGSLDAVSLVIGGNVQITDGVDATSDANLGSAAVLTLGAAGIIDLQANPAGSAPELVGPSIMLESGTLEGNGTLVGTISNLGATLSPGASPGMLGVTGTLVELPGSALTMEIGGTAAGQYDVIAVNGSAALGGTLHVSLTDGFVPQTGDSFTLLTATTPLTGDFASLDLPDLSASGLSWQVTTTGTAVVLEVTSPSVNQPPHAVDDSYAVNSDAILTDGITSGSGGGATSSGSGDLVNGLGGPAGFGEGVLPANDDGSTAAIDITSVFEGGIDFFGTTYTEIYVNNNGNVTFGGPLGTYTPFALTGDTGIPIIAPYFADVDTSGGPVAPSPGGNSTGSNLVYYDLDPTGGPNGQGVLTVTWDDVGYYGGHTDLTNAFQLRLYDQGNGDFTIELRYEDVQWTTGDASGGTGGLGGTVARAGFSAGDGVTYFEFPQSGDQAAMLALPSSVGSAIVVAQGGTVTAGVLNNDTDPDGDALTVTALNGSPGAVGTPTTLPSGALVTLGADGSLRYDPNGAFAYLAPGATAVDSFTYEVSDGHGGTDTATVSVMVTGVLDQPPTTTGLADVHVDEDAPDTVVNLAGAFNDTEDGASGLTYTVESDSNPALFAGVTVDLGTDTLTLDYAPNAYGSADITVRATDSNGQWVESSFSVVVNPQPDTLTWTNAGSDGNWNNPGNWDLGFVPENGDSVIIPSGVDVTFSGDVSLAELSLDGQTLTLAPGAALTVADLSLSHANLNGDGQVSISAAFSFDGGQIGGQVQLVTEAGSTTTLSASAASALADAASWSSFGTVTWGGTGDFSVSDAAVFTNEAGATFDIGTGAGLLGDGQVVNLGTMNKTDPSTTSVSPAFDQEGSLNIDGGTLAFGGGFTQGGTGMTTLLNGGTLATSDGPVDLQGGALAGIGSVDGDLSQGGSSLTPGFSPGEILITGSWTLGSGSTTVIELAGPGAAGVDYDQVAVTGTAGLDGTLHVVLLGGYVPAAGDSFSIVSYGTRTGQFQTLDLPDISAQGLQWTISYTATGVQLTATAPSASTTPQTSGGSNPPPSQLTETSGSNTGIGGGPSQTESSLVQDAATFTPDYEDTDYISSVINDQSLDGIYGTEQILSAFGGGGNLPAGDLFGDADHALGAGATDQTGANGTGGQGGGIPGQENAALGGAGLSDSLSGEAGQLSAEAAQIMETLREAAQYLRCGR